MKLLWLIPNRMVPWYHELALALTSSENIHITFLTFSHQQKESVRRSKVHNIDQIVIKTPRGWIDLITFKFVRISRVRREVRKIAKDFDIIHVHGTEHQYQTAISGLKIPIISSIQGILSEYRKVVPRFSKTWISWTIGAFFEQQGIRKHQNYFCRTHWDKGFVHNVSPEARIFHCWEMIRQDFFELALDPSARDGIAFLGGSNGIKGYRELLRAFDQSFHQMEGAILYIAGSVDSKTIWEFISSQELSNLNENNIQIIGHLDIDRHLELFSKCRMLAHPSYIDNSPNTICEAQIAGLPVLATDVGGVSSLVKHGETGYLINRTINSLAHGMAVLYNDPNLLEKISDCASRLAKERHSKKEIISNTKAAYETILLEKN